ncbi:DoxX family protein [Hylemonella gracilis]|uniref:DoxX family protein n=1 Tax=Hylemonella gracilis TaxID=80880 RepID=A0A4P6UM85_9BURK|nr:DoxX family protein [Hylemonella gracilis]QBK05694.1 DoxX family protein [Hylemonella gracilis]
MFNQLQAPITLIGRILLALLFVPAGINKISSFSGVAGYVSSTMHLPQFMGYAGAAVAIFVEVVLGLALLVGFKTRWSAFILAIFTVVAGFFFHNFWNMLVDPGNMQQIHFFKNLAIAGGLLAFAAFGPGRLSFDGSRG